jgi:signal transduction histidine kinase
MAKEHELGEKIENYDQVLDRSLERIRGMRSLILDMLDLTKVESGKGTRDVVDTDLVKIARSAIDAVRPYSIQRDIRINLKGPEQLVYKSDSDEMEIIFNNLISNAIKYNIDGGSVDCCLEEKDQNICITVEDSGIGMTEAEMSRLFQDFVRIKNEKTKNISGSGLGLSIVKKLTESYGGNIDVSSIPDKGSKFIVSFPKEKLCS